MRYAPSYVLAACLAAPFLLTNCSEDAGGGTTDDGLAVDTGAGPAATGSAPAPAPSPSATPTASAPNPIPSAPPDPPAVPTPPPTPQELPEMPVGAAGGAGGAPTTPATGGAGGTSGTPETPAGGAGGGAAGGTPGSEPATGGAGGAVIPAANGGAGGMGEMPAPAEPGVFTVTSTAFADGEEIPDTYTCEGKAFGAGPIAPLEWTGVPAEALSLAVTFVDTTLAPGNANGYHWAIWDIPTTTTGLPEDLPFDAELAEPAGAKQFSPFDPPGFLGPCPNFVGSGNVDEYAFTVHALDVATLPDPPMNAQQLITLIEMHSIGSAVLSGTSDAAPN